MATANVTRCAGPWIFPLYRRAHCVDGPPACLSSWASKTRHLVKKVEARPWAKGGASQIQAAEARSTCYPRRLVTITVGKQHGFQGLSSCSMAQPDEKPGVASRRKLNRLDASRGTSLLDSTNNTGRAVYVTASLEVQHKLPRERITT